MALIAPLPVRIAFIVSVIIAWSAFSRFWLSKTASSDRAVSILGLAEAVFLGTVSVVLVIGWVSVILATFGQFSLLFLTLLVVGASVSLWWFTDSAVLPLSIAMPPDLSVLALMGLILGCTLVYFRPHEYVLGGSDAGTYVNMAATMARTGGLVIHDDWGALLAEHAPVMLREQPERWRSRYLQFVGWYIDDHDPTRWVPQFFPFHPALLAVGVSLYGIRGALMVTPIWGVLSIAAVYFLARRLFGLRVAIASSVLLAITPLQIWFSRYPTTEPLTLLLVFSGLLGFQVVWERSARHGIMWGAFGGASLGAALLTRIDLPIIWAFVILWLILRWATRDWTRGLTAFAVSLGVFSIHAILSATLISWPYVWNTYGAALQRFRIVPSWSLLYAAVGFALVGGAVLWAIRRQHGLLGRLRLRPPWGQLARRIAAVSLVLLSLYAYFVRPSVSDITYWESWPAGVSVPVLNSQNWLRMGWYLTPLGVLVATLGAARLLAVVSLRRMGLFLIVGLVTTLQYVYDAFNMPYHIYVMRRYVPVVLPMLMIYISVAIEALWQSNRRELRITGAVLAIGLCGGLLYQSRYVLPHTDFRGMTDQIAALNASLSPGAVVVMAEPSEAINSDHFGVPLRFIYGHRIATLREESAAALEAFDAVLEYARERSLPVELLAVRPIPETVRRHAALKPLESVPLRFEVLESSYFSFPSRVEPVSYSLDLYRITGTMKAEPQSAPSNLDIDVGGLDTHFVLDGFYGKETWPDGVTARWTAGRAMVLFPAAEGTAMIQIRLQRVLYPGSRATAVTVYADRADVGTFFPPSDEWKTLEIPVALAPVGGWSKLVLETDTFNPAALGISSDDRDLGVAVDQIRLVQFGSPD